MYIKKSIEVYKHGGVRFLIKRMLDYSIVKIKRLFQRKSISHYQGWQSLKNKYRGERVFLLGSGPSLNRTPLYLLKDEFTMCVNKVDLLMERLNWHPDFYIVTDDMKIIENREVINRQIIPKTTYSFFPDLHPSNVNFKKYIHSRSNVYWLNTDAPKFSKNLPKCGINNTVTLAGLQVLAFLGFSEIYLLGVDMDFKTRNIVRRLNRTEVLADSNDDCNHFDPRYDGIDSSYTIPLVDAMLENFEKAKRFYEGESLKIYNATIGGNLNTFERTNIRDVLKLPQDEEEKLFIELTGHDPSTWDFNRLCIEYRIIYSKHEFERDLPSFIINEHVFDSFLVQAIFTHIPLGPFAGKYFFKKRDEKDGITPKEVASAL